MEDSKKYDHLVKIIMIGDTSVGKSKIVERFVFEQFSEKFTTTVGVDSFNKIIEMRNNIVKVCLWDTAGQERFRSVTRIHYRGAVGALLCYDTTSKDSFAECKKWLRDLQYYGDEGMIITLVGTKVDIHQRREVEQFEGQNFAVENGLNFIETSAKSGHNVEEAFMSLLKKIPFSETSGRIGRYFRESKSRSDNLKNITSRFYLPPKQKIHDTIFHDNGRFHETFQSNPHEERPETHAIYDTTTCDLRNDPKLRDLFSSLKQKFPPDSKTSKIQIAKKIIPEIHDFFGSPTPPIEKFVEKCELRVEELKILNSSNYVPLGDVQGAGNSQHRSILYKMICDEYDIPCAIVRGWIRYDERNVNTIMIHPHPHYWNELILVKKKKKKPNSPNSMVDALNFRTTFVQKRHMNNNNNNNNNQYFVIPQPSPVTEKERFVVTDFIRINYSRLLKLLIGSSPFRTVFHVLREEEDGEEENGEIIIKVGNNNNNNEEFFDLNLSDFVVKEVNLTDLKGKYGVDAVKRVKKETEIMHYLSKNENVVEIVGYFTLSNNFMDEILHVVMKKYDFSLAGFLKYLQHEGLDKAKRVDTRRNNNNNNKNNNDWKKSLLVIEIIILFLEVAKGLKSIHSLGMYHMNLKPTNVLLNWSLEDATVSDVRLSDFGSFETRVGGEGIKYVDPEILKFRSGVIKKKKKKKKFGISLWEKADVYSIGRLMSDFREFYASRREIVVLEELCMSKNPEKRPSLTQIITQFETSLAHLKKCSNESGIQSGKWGRSKVVVDIVPDSIFVLGKYGNNRKVDSCNCN